MSITEFFDPASPSDADEYRRDFADWLTDGDRIVAASVAVTPAGMTVQPAAYDAQSVSVWLSGGTAGVTYTVAFSVSTALGRICTKSVLLPIEYT